MSLSRSINNGLLYQAGRKLYTDFFRDPLAKFLFDQLELPLLTRQSLYEGPPDFVEDFQEISSPEVITIDPPRGIGPVPADLRKMVRDWEFVSPFVFVAKNVDLVGPHALPIASGHRYVIEATDGSTYRVTDELIRTIASGHAPLHRGTGDKYDMVVSFAGPWSGEYFHWFADYLPRLRVLERWEQRMNYSPSIVIPSDPPSWITESLDLLDIDRQRRIEWPGGRISVGQLVVPSMPRHTHSTSPPEGYVHSPRELEWVRTRLKNAVETDSDPNVAEKIYVSRSEQTSRHIRNEDEVLAVAREYGFEKVHPEGWTLKKQIQVFNEAKTVLGPHGAGLLNTIYGKNTRLIELFGKRTNPCYFTIAQALNIPYWMMQCEATGHDLLVDPDRLRKLLKLACD